MKLPHKPENGSSNRAFSFTVKLLGLAVGLFLVYWFVRQVDPQIIKAKLIQINWQFLYILGITFLAYLMVSIAWYQSFLSAPPNVSIMDLFCIRLSGESLAQVNPTNVIAGDTLKAYLLKRKGVEYKKGVVSITISRFLIVLSGITLILLGALIFFDLLNIISLTKKVIIISLITLLAFLSVWLIHSGNGLLYFPIKLITTLSSKFSRFVFLKKTVNNLKEVDSEINLFYKTKKGSFLSAYFLSFLHWITGAMEYYIILSVLGFDISVLSCVAIEVGVNTFKLIGAFVPGQIGIEELGVNKMLAFAGINGVEIYLTVAIIRRARQLFWIAAGALIFFIIIKKTKEINNGSVVYNT